MDIRTKLLQGGTVCGTWLQTGSPVAAEIMADNGFDFIAADMEHTDMDEAAFSAFARSVSGRTAPLARVRENDTLAIRRVLDCGAAGVIVPLIDSKESAKRAVEAAKYPPEGVRGFAFVRANRWGRDFDQYAAAANQQTLVIVMIETKQAVEQIDDILSVDGVDGVLIGPYDLSGSYGVPGQTGHALVRDAKDKVLRACKAHGKAAGQHIVLPTPDNVKEALQTGYRFLALGMDTVFLDQGARDAASFLNQMEGI